MKDQTPFRSRFFTALVCLALAIPTLWPSGVLAQAYSSQLTFLEDFAVKLYERGDTAQAEKEFQRLLRIDPQSATAQKYLAEIAKGAAPSPAPSRTTMERAGAIATDIQLLKKDITHYESDMATLESLVRNLISENDQLYMSLHKRSREVMELREKAYGIRYSDQYREVMSELPPDRLPQNLHRTDDILPQLPVHAASSDINSVTDRFSQANADASALAADIAKTEEEIKDLTAKGAEGKAAEELQKALDEKRSVLVEKNLALMEKKDHLTSLKGELVSINQDLKTANNRYIELIDKIDKYYLGIKAELSAKNFVEQKMFSDLVYDYAKKTKELEALKQASAAPALPAAAPIAAKAPAAVPSEAGAPVRAAVPAGTEAAAAAEQQRFSELMTSYETKAKELEDLRRSISQRDEKLADYKAPLASQDEKIKALDQALAEKDKELAGLKAQLAYADQAIGGVSSQVKNIQALLTESDSDMAGLSEGINRIKTLIQDQKTLGEKKAREIVSLAVASNDKAAKTRELEQKVASLGSTLTDKDLAIDTLQKKLTNSEKKLADLSIKLSAKEEDVLKLEERLSLKDEEAAKLHEALTARPQTAVPQTAMVSAPAAPSSSERERLRTAISEREQKIAELKTTLEAKETEVKKLTEALAVSRQKIDDEAATRKSKEDQAAQLSSQLEEQKTLFDRTATSAQKDIVQTRRDLQTRELDIKERELSLQEMKEALSQRAAALLEAENQVKALGEKLAALEIKQKAIRSVVDKRDSELAKLTSDLNASGDSIRAAQKKIAELTARAKDAATAVALAEEKLRESAARSADSQKQLEQLRRDLKTAQQAIKSRDRDLEELARVKDELAKRDRIITDLQERLNRK